MVRGLYNSRIPDWPAGGGAGALGELGQVLAMAVGTGWQGWQRGITYLLYKEKQQKQVEEMQMIDTAPYTNWCNTLGLARPQPWHRLQPSTSCQLRPVSNA